MDGTSNEFENLDVEAFPSLFFFKSGIKNSNLMNKKKITYEGEINLSNIINFLKISINEHNQENSNLIQIDENLHLFSNKITEEKLNIKNDL